MKICFYAPVEDVAMLTYNQFYAQDIRILRELADDVVITTRARDLPRDVDLYFIWWWSWAFLPLSLAKVLRKPTIVTGVLNMHDPMEGQNYFTRPWRQRALMAYALREASANIFVGMLEYRDVPRYLATRNPSYSPLIVDGDTHPYHGGAGREPFLFTLAWMHGVNPYRKGVDLSIRAHAQILKRHPAMELRIAGSPGDAEAKFRALVAELGTTDRVRFLGRVEHDEKVRLLQTCTAYLQPSSYEGFGVAAAEAMAAGAPVVATRVGALPEVLGDDAVWAADRSVEAVAAAIEEATTGFSEERRRRAAERIRHEFRYERRRDDVASVIQNVLSPREF